MLEFEDYGVAYGQSEVIKSLNLSVKPNEIIAIVGRNGMGKSTLMKSVAGMIPSQKGSLKLKDVPIEHMKSFDRVKAGVALVPQGRMIFSTMTVTENIQTGLTTVKNKKVPELLYDLFPVLKEMRSRRGGNLSGGQQQQLAIARALASQPEVLLLDEPTEGIQPSIIKEIARTLKKIRDDLGLTILVSEQVLSFALDVADRILVLEKGSVVHDQARDEVDRDQVAAYLSV